MNRLLGMTAAIGLATAAMPAAAITWGGPDGKDHPNVVALLVVQNGIGLFSCSGKLPPLRKFGDVRMARVKPGSRQARVVGQGLHGKIPALAGDDFVRHAAPSSVAGLAVSDTIGAQNIQFTNNPGNGGGLGGTCSGDSGRPAFAIDTLTGAATSSVMAVNSYGVAPKCNGNDYQFRTDIAAAREFILSMPNHAPD